MQMITDKQTEPPFGPWEFCPSGPPAASGVDSDPGILAYGPLGAGPKQCPLLGLLLGLVGALRAEERLSLRRGTLKTVF